ncbi:MAG: hypothetical protein D4S02_10555 [Rhodocyclaceae bacterium]|nr:MAG: hypothetical protein D4S02_10555 [Rhodocyclaceae bacterium]
MSVRDDFDPNTNKPFHLFLLGIVAFGLWFSSGVSFLLSAFLVGWVFSRWIVEGFGFLASKGEAAAVAEWNGRYFAYYENQVRIVWDRTHIWVNAADVFLVLGLSPDAVTRKKISARLGLNGYGIPSKKAGECFSEQGIAAYLNGFNDLKTAQFRRWLERDVLAVLNKQRECGTPEFEHHKID